MKFENQVIYQIYPKSFMDSNNDGIGDIKGIISKLDYLANLGIDYLWLSPVNKSPQNDNGYDISNYLDIDPMFGTLDDYKQLIREAKARHIKLMLDLVINHSSTEHEWFKSALKGEKKYQEYYILRDKPTDLKSIFGGEAWVYSEKLGCYYLAMFDKTQADLNYHSASLLNEIKDMINFWINLGVEGFRLDVIDMIGKDVDSGNLSRTPFFYELLKDIQNNTFKKDYLTVGECWSASILDANKLTSKDGLSEIFDFENMAITNNNGNKWDYKEPDFNELMKVFDKWQNHYDKPTLVFSNHDNPRIISRLFGDLAKTKNKELQKLVIGTYALLKGNLYIYQGDEIGTIDPGFKDICDYKDVETLNKYHELISKGMSEEEAMKVIIPTSRDNARVPIAWDDTEFGGFSEVSPWIKCNPNKTRINVKEDLESSDSVYEFYKKVIKFRKDNYHLFTGTYDFRYHVEASLISIYNDNFMGLFNYGSDPIEITHEEELVLTSGDNDPLILNPYEAKIYKIN